MDLKKEIKKYLYGNENERKREIIGALIRHDTKVLEELVKLAPIIISKSEIYGEKLHEINDMYTFDIVNEMHEKYPEVEKGEIERITMEYNN